MGKVWNTAMLFMIFVSLGVTYGKMSSDSSNFPRREYSVIVSNEGYYPDKLLVFQGERVKFFITSTIDEPSCFMLPEKNLFMSVNKGKISENEVLFDTPGVYKFYCPAGKIKGTITVIPRGKANNDSDSDDDMVMDRSVASEKFRVWKPRTEE